MNEQKQLLHGLWRKAASLSEPLAIPCKTKGNATRLRFALYNSVRDIRSGKASADTALLSAVENYSVGFSPEDASTLLIQRKIMTELMGIVAEVVGDAAGMVKSDEEMEAEASQARVLQRLQASSSGATPATTAPASAPAPNLRSTPYYTREGS